LIEQPICRHTVQTMESANWSVVSKPSDANSTGVRVAMTLIPVLWPMIHTSAVQTNLFRNDGVRRIWRYPRGRDRSRSTCALIWIISPRASVALGSDLVRCRRSRMAAASLSRLDQPPRRFGQEEQRREERDPEDGRDDVVEAPLVAFRDEAEAERETRADDVCPHDAHALQADQQAAGMWRRDLAHVSRSCTRGSCRWSSRRDAGDRSPDDEHGDVRRGRSEDEEDGCHPGVVAQRPQALEMCDWMTAPTMAPPRKLLNDNKRFV